MAVVLFLVNSRASKKVAVAMALSFTVLKFSVDSLHASKEELSDRSMVFTNPLVCISALVAFVTNALIAGVRRDGHLFSTGAMLIAVFCQHRCLKFRTTGHYRSGERLMVAVLHFDDFHWKHTLSTIGAGRLVDMALPLLAGNPGKQRTVFAKYLFPEWFHGPVWGHARILRRKEQGYNKMAQKTRMLDMMVNTPDKDVFVLYPRGGWPETKDFVSPGFVHLSAASGANLCICRATSLDSKVVLFDSVYINGADEPSQRPDGFRDISWPEPKPLSQPLGDYLEAHREALQKIHTACIDELTGTQCKVH